MRRRHLVRLLVAPLLAAGVFVALATTAGTQPPPPKVLPNVGSVVEGDAPGSTVVEVPVSLSAASSGEVTVQWETIMLPMVDPSVRAEEGVDYTVASGQVTFVPDDVDEVVSIEVLGDDLDENDELIVVRFHSPTNATVGGFYGLGVGVITDDDEPPPPAITVTPDTDLDGGDLVTVTGTGWTPGTTVGVCQADAVPADPPEDGCLGRIGYGAFTTTADGAGEFSVPYRLRRWGFIPARASYIDCTDPATPCVMGAGDLADLGATRASAPLPFAPPPPPPAVPGEIVVTPSTDLIDGETLTVDGTGFRPAAAIELYPCTSPAGFDSCDYSKRVDLEADAVGAFTTTMPARRLLFGSVDCLTTSCEIGSAEAVDFVGTITSTPITFAPPPPKVLPNVGSVVEGDAPGSTVVEVPVSLSAASSGEVTVQW
ncbi:MAG: neocarzinostatin apoprotein domain-containing protein, partial [Acidimicrobiia bacterium]|nr:neocarzinostatin apoprotein domain-containing protein [Acidimicrobiia bacterium]